jgi:Tol biopolymer transport system component
MAGRKPYLSALIAAAVLVACAAALLAMSPEAEAAFPGENGRIAFSEQRCDSQSGIVCDDPEIATMSRNGGGRKQLTDNSRRREEKPAFSPDGRRIAFQVQVQRGTYDIYTVGRSGGGASNLTRNFRDTEWQPAFSPDGTRIAYSEDDGDLFVMRADGTGRRELLDKRRRELYAEDPAWSPGGTKIAFSGSARDAGGARNGDVYVMDADGTGLRRLTDSPGNDRDPAWSPDGTKIAFGSDRAEEGERYYDGDVYVMDGDGANERDLTRNENLNEYDPAWSPNGIEIAFVGFRYPDQEIFKINVDGTGWRNLTNTPATQETQPDWGPRVTTSPTP